MPLWACWPGRWSLAICNSNGCANGAGSFWPSVKSCTAHRPKRDWLGALVGLLLAARDPSGSPMGTREGGARQMARAVSPVGL
jgi:hypothetical protein